MPRRTQQRPFVFINMSMTADGKIASADRKLTHFSSPIDIENLFRLRATADAILCGARTIEESDAILESGSEKFRRARKRNHRTEDPLRIIATGSGTISSKARIWSERFSPIIALTSRRASVANRKRLEQLADCVWIDRADTVDFRAVVEWLYEQFAVRRLLCEGGGELNDALFRAGLVDEIHITLCPLILGGRKSPTLADGEGVECLADALKFRLQSARQRGDELYLVYSRCALASSNSPSR